MGLSQPVARAGGTQENVKVSYGALLLRCYDNLFGEAKRIANIKAKG